MGKHFSVLRNSYNATTFFFVIYKTRNFSLRTKWEDRGCHLDVECHVIIPWTIMARVFYSATLLVDFICFVDYKKERSMTQFMYRNITTKSYSMFMISFKSSNNTFFQLHSINVCWCSRVSHFDSSTIFDKHSLHMK
jgi:hypothetical protein